MTSKSNFILDYFKPKNEVFDLVLVDIKKSFNINIHGDITNTIKCGELNEQQIETPDYTAHITSFHIDDLRVLFKYILREPDLKEVPYLWIDAISINQQNHSKKKESILQMNQIYKNATYILAVPDLHKRYLLKHPANKEIIAIYDDNYLPADNCINNDIKSLTTNSIQQQYDNNYPYSLIQKLTTENEKLKIEMKEYKDQEVKKLYLIEDWSNRAWIISEYHIEKEKYMKQGIPLKYMFTSLQIIDDDYYQLQQYSINNENGDKNKNKIITYEDVNDQKTFNQFVKTRFMQRTHLEMILNSNATRNEGRFNAILPSWNEYNHFIKNKNTLSEWNITDMTSVG
ncbi:unnamed protein product [Cunninghamella blakesleeana]